MNAHLTRNVVFEWHPEAENTVELQKTVFSCVATVLACIFFGFGRCAPSLTQRVFTNARVALPLDLCQQFFGKKITSFQVWPGGIAGSDFHAKIFTFIHGQWFENKRGRTIDTPPERGSHRMQSIYKAIENKCGQKTWPDWRTIATRRLRFVPNNFCGSHVAAISYSLKTARQMKFARRNAMFWDGMAAALIDTHSHYVSSLWQWASAPMPSQKRNCNERNWPEMCVPFRKHESYVFERNEAKQFQNTMHVTSLGPKKNGGQQVQVRSWTCRIATPLPGATRYCTKCSCVCHCTALILGESAAKYGTCQRKRWFESAWNIVWWKDSYVALAQLTYICPVWEAMPVLISRLEGEKESFQCSSVSRGPSRPFFFH